MHVLGDCVVSGNTFHILYTMIIDSCFMNDKYYVDTWLCMHNKSVTV